MTDSKYLYKNNPLNLVVSGYSTGTKIDNYTPDIKFDSVSISNGNAASITIPYNNKTTVPYNVWYNGTAGTGINETSPWSSGSDENVNPGNTQPTQTIDLNDFVRNRNYSKIIGILAGGGGGGGGAGACSGRPTGGGGGSGGFMMFEMTLTEPSSNSTLKLYVGGAGNGGQGSARTDGGSGGGGIGQRGGSGGSTSIKYYSGNSGNTSEVIAGGGGYGGAYNKGIGGTNSKSGVGITEIYNFSGKDGTPGSNGSSVPGGSGALYGQTFDADKIGNNNIYTFQPANSGTTRYINQYNISNYNEPTTYGGIGGGGGTNYNTNYGWGGYPGSFGYGRIFFIT